MNNLCFDYNEDELYVGFSAFIYLVLTACIYGAQSRHVATEVGLGALHPNVFFALPQQKTDKHHF